MTTNPCRAITSFNRQIHYGQSVFLVPRELRDVHPGKVCLERTSDIVTRTRSIAFYDEDGVLKVFVEGENDPVHVRYVSPVEPKPPGRLVQPRLYTVSHRLIRGRIVPVLRLQGIWVEQAGFPKRTAVHAAVPEQGHLYLTCGEPYEPGREMLRRAKVTIRFSAVHGRSVIDLQANWLTDCGFPIGQQFVVHRLTPGRLFLQVSNVPR